MGLLIVLFLALGHDFILSFSSCTSGNSRTCLGSPGSRRQSGFVCCGSLWSSCPWHSWQLQQLHRQAGQCWSELCSPTWGRRVKKGSGGNTTAADISRALVLKAEGHYIAAFDARTCALQEDINWMAHSSVVGLGITQSCSRPPSPSQPSLSGSSCSQGCAPVDKLGWCLVAEKVKHLLLCCLLKVFQQSHPQELCFLCHTSL